MLAAADPANPYGATLKWPADARRDGGRGATRTVGATVVLVDGALAAYLARGDRQLLTGCRKPSRSAVAPRAPSRTCSSTAHAPATTRRAAC